MIEQIFNVILFVCAGLMVAIALTPIESEPTWGYMPSCTICEKYGECGTNGTNLDCNSSGVKLGYTSCVYLFEGNVMLNESCKELSKLKGETK